MAITLIRVPVDGLEGFTRRAFMAMGVSEEEARRCTRGLIESELHCLPGQGQGVRRLPVYHERIKNGWIVPGAAFEIVKETPALALVDGHPPTPRGRIEAPIGRDPAHRKRMAVVPQSRGRQAMTEYRSLEVFIDHELIEVHPTTGRTHQIRLHLAFIGCPVAGDQVYGKRHPSLGLKRTFLHALSLSLILPGEKKITTFEADLPEELVQVLTDLRKNKKV